MGLFYMLDKMKQVDSETENRFMRVRHTVSLEMHEATETSLNYLTIGGFNKSIVKEPKNIVWAPIFCSQHWEIKLANIMISDSVFSIYS